MRWRRSSQTQIEDRRGGGGFGGLGGGALPGSSGGLGGGIPLPIGGGLGGIIVLVLFLFLSGALSGGGSGGLGGLGGGEAPGGGAFQSLDPADEQAQFLNAVTVDVQTYWEKSFQAAGKQYPTTVLVLFSQATQTGCGAASSATGPFYCPADQKVYLDTGFFDALASKQFGAPGDFAQAYVIAHEFGHHVQNALGIMDQVASEQQSNPDRANDQSIRLELQADCLAGTWAHSVWAQPDQSDIESITEEDISEAIKATEGVGDDRIQEQATGTINKESWTHGSAEQRTKWFQTGFQQGTTEGCDTFAVAQP